MKRADRVRLIGEIVPRLAARPWFDVEVLLREYGLLSYRLVGHDNEPESDIYIAEMMSGASDDALLEIVELVGGRPPDRPVPADVQNRIWGDAVGFRLFLSHISSQRNYVGQVASRLSALGIATFVAHVDIEPSREWMDEIVAALTTCEGLAAFLHDGFASSPWTDQEAGVVLGRGLLVIPIKFGSDPHGFLSRYQAVEGDKDVAGMAEKLFDVLVSNEGTHDSIAPQLVRTFETSRSYASARATLSYLERLPVLSGELLRKIEEAERDNNQVSESSGVPARIEALFRRHGYEPQASTASYDEYGEEPF